MTPNQDVVMKHDIAKLVKSLQYPPIPEGLPDRQVRFLEAYVTRPYPYAALKAAGYEVDSQADADKIMYNLRRNKDVVLYLAQIDTLLGLAVDSSLVSSEQAQSLSFYNDMPLHLLSAKQRAFVLNWCGDDKAALKAAGLSPTKQNVLRIKSLPAVRTCLDRVREYMDTAVLMKTQDIVSRIQDIVDEPSVSAAVRLKALDMLAGFHGMKSEKLIIEAKTATPPPEPFKTPKFIGTSAVIDTSED